MLWVLAAGAFTVTPETIIDELADTVMAVVVATALAGTLIVTVTFCELELLKFKVEEGEKLQATPLGHESVTVLAKKLPGIDTAKVVLDEVVPGTAVTVADVGRPKAKSVTLIVALCAPWCGKQK